PVRRHAEALDRDLVRMHESHALHRRDGESRDGLHTVASSRAPRPSGASVSSSKTKKSRRMTCTATLYTGTVPTAPANVPSCACPCSTRSGRCFWIGPSSRFVPRYVQIDSGSPTSVLIVGE